MEIKTAEKPYLRLREVCRLTGWNWRYVVKLAESGLIRPVSRRGRNWYRRTEIQKLIKGG